jgi:hypothetical protein
LCHILSLPGLTKADSVQKHCLNALNNSDASATH